MAPEVPPADRSGIPAALDATGHRVVVGGGIGAGQERRVRGPRAPGLPRGQRRRGRPPDSLQVTRRRSARLLSSGRMPSRIGVVDRSLLASEVFADARQLEARRRRSCIPHRRGPSESWSTQPVDDIVDRGPAPAAAWTTPVSHVRNFIRLPWWPTIGRGSLALWPAVGMRRTSQAHEPVRPATRRGVRGPMCRRQLGSVERHRGRRHRVDRRARMAEHRPFRGRQRLPTKR